MNNFLLLHLITIVPVLIMGPFILLQKKGDKLHRLLGKIWCVLMIISCLLTFGITHNGSYSWLHGLALFTLWQVVRAIGAIKRKDLKTHQRAMIGSYIGTVIAFIFASLVPGRLISEWLQKGIL